MLLRGAAIPSAWVGAVRYPRDETDALLAVLFAYLALAWSVDDDLFFIPDHGSQLLRTDHHGVIHVECSSQEQLRQLVAMMAGAGYNLPDEPPDGTFRRPAWMKESPSSE